MNPKIDSLHEIPQIEERKVRIERIVFYNEINSYTVFSCIDIDTKNPEMFTAVGEMPPEIEGREFRIKGTFSQHPKHKGLIKQNAEWQDDSYGQKCGEYNDRRRFPRTERKRRRAAALSADRRIGFPRTDELLIDEDVYRRDEDKHDADRKARALLRLDGRIE